MQSIISLGPERNMTEKSPHICSPFLMHLSVITGWQSMVIRSNFKARKMKANTRLRTLGIYSSCKVRSLQFKNFLEGHILKAINSLEKARSINHFQSAEDKMLSLLLWRSKMIKEISLMYGWLNHNAILTPFSCNPATHNYLNTCYEVCMG